MHQTRVEKTLGEMHDELAAFIFTAAKDWQRSLRVTPEKRDLLCAAISEYLDQIKAKA